MANDILREDIVYLLGNRRIRNMSLGAFGVENVNRKLLNEMCDTIALLKEVDDKTAISLEPEKNRLLQSLCEDMQTEINRLQKLLLEKDIKGDKETRRANVDLWVSLVEERNHLKSGVAVRTFESCMAQLSTPNLTTEMEQSILLSMVLILNHARASVQMSTPTKGGKRKTRKQESVVLRYVDRLACIFSRILNKIVDIGETLTSGHEWFITTFVTIFDPTFKWLCQKMDALENQCASSISNNPLVRGVSKSFSQQLLSFMYNQTALQANKSQLERKFILDISSCRHIAFVLDAFMHSLSRQTTFLCAAHYAGAFFDRTASIESQGFRQTPIFDATASKAYPLAEHPEYLSATFSFPSYESETVSCTGRINSQEPLSLRNTTHKLLLNRWQLTVSDFVEKFLSCVGMERNCFFKHRVHHEAREKVFRHKMEQEKTRAAVKNIELTVSSKINTSLITDTILQLNSLFKNRGTPGEKQPLSCSEVVKVSFTTYKKKEDEEEEGVMQQGDGSGVFLNFLANLKHVVLDENSTLPPPPSCLCNSTLKTNSLSHTSDALLLMSGGDDLFIEADVDLSCLFWEKREHKYALVSPHEGRVSAYRMSCFRNIGRLAGFCLLHNVIFPIQFDRHVYKYILGRELGYHDMAFYDVELYEQFRNMIVTARDVPETFSETYDLSFVIGGKDIDGKRVDIELCPKGATEVVTPENVEKFVKLAALYWLQNRCEFALKALRMGILVI